MNAIDQVQIRAFSAIRRRFSPQLLLVGILVFALVVRIMIMWPYVIDNGFFGGSDDHDYHALAVSLVDHGLLGQQGTPSAYRMPLFPLFLAAIYRVVGPDRIIAQAIIMLLSVLNVALTYAVGRQLANARVGLIAAVIAAFDLDQIAYAGQLLTETLCIFFFTLSMLALVRLRRNSDWRWAVGVGIVLGLTVLIRVNILLVVPVAIAWLLRYGVGLLRKRILLVAIVVALCGGLWSTWVIRNYVVFGAFIPLTTQGGNGYYGIYNDEAAAPQPLKRFGSWRNLKLPAEIIQSSEVEGDRRQRQLAFKWIQANPLKAVQIALVQAYHFWDVEINPFYLPTLLLAIGGSSWLIRRRDPDGLIWLLLFATLTLLSIVTLAVTRFHLPLLPGIAALAAIALERIWMRITRYLPKRALS